ncbi:hypothetical protein Rhe02_09490 [Rhizocola hellebori]|uniref:Uncharacterized protein n=1 Tax=Rhizocola hellebori TaxID=1392758 RepID=A0A8J3Q3M7_9ACTN|nr:hypothetical protein [Rhizocola hellebori]GIH02882.1 hypothetical protein Rhe02_09490 [Rhizocola hellebori]
MFTVTDQIAGRWWNGKYGMARRDVWLFQVDGTWRVDARQGKDDAKVWHSHFESEVDARASVTGMLERTAEDGWRDLTRIVMDTDHRREAGS